MVSSFDNKNIKTTTTHPTKVHLVVQVKQVGVVFPDVCLCIGDQLPDVSAWAQASFRTSEF